MLLGPSYWSCLTHSQVQVFDFAIFNEFIGISRSDTGKWGKMKSTSKNDYESKESWIFDYKVLSEKLKQEIN